MWKTSRSLPVKPPQQHVLSHIPDRRRLAVPPDGEQQLVLRTSETHGLRLPLAPVLESAQPVPERQQPGEVLVSEPHRSLSHIA